MFRTEVICSRVMFGWSASNLLIRPWSTKSSAVLAAGRLIPSRGTVVAAGAGRDTSGMFNRVDNCGIGDVCTRGGRALAGRGVVPAEPRGAVEDV